MSPSGGRLLEASGTWTPDDRAENQCVAVGFDVPRDLPAVLVELDVRTRRGDGPRPRMPGSRRLRRLVGRRPVALRRVGGLVDARVPAHAGHRRAVGGARRPASHPPGGRALPDPRLRGLARHGRGRARPSARRASRARTWSTPGATRRRGDAVVGRRLPRAYGALRRGAEHRGARRSGRLPRARRPRGDRPQHDEPPSPPARRWGSGTASSWSPGRRSLPTADTRTRWGTSGSSTSATPGRSGSGTSRRAAASCRSTIRWVGTAAGGCPSTVPQRSRRSGTPRGTPSPCCTTGVGRWRGGWPGTGPRHPSGGATSTGRATTHCPGGRRRGC